MFTTRGEGFTTAMRYSPASDLLEVSIVIPTRGREGLLRRALESCVEAASGLQGLEVVVAVDGEPVTYAPFLAELSIPARTIRTKEPVGRGRARNLGLESAQGKYVKFLDDDDWLEPGVLAEEVAVAAETRADIVASGYFTVGEGEEARYWQPPAFSHGVDSILQGEAVPTAAALYSRHAIGSLRWDVNHAKLDDWHFFIRVALRSSVIARLDRPSFTWYSHPGQGVQKASMLDNARDFYWVLDEMEGILASSGALTAERRRRLAQYRYKELRVLCRYDRPAFEAEVRKLELLDPEFRPTDGEPRAYIRLLGRAFGTRRAVLLHEAIRRVAEPIRRPPKVWSAA